MLSHCGPLVLVLAIASAQATMLSFPLAAPPASGSCRQALQTAEDRLLALQTGLESKSEALLALQLTFDRIFQLLNLDVSELPNEIGFSIDGHENDTIIEETNVGGSGSPGDDEDMTRDLEKSGLSSNDEDMTRDLEGSGLSSDDEDMTRDLEKRGLSSDDEDMTRDLEGSGLSSDDEDMTRDLEGSGLSSYDKIW